ncbi:baseplate hub protein, partial [Escherichia coli]|uniref:baseplate hub protein n=1 Tax=Escherichia coli TaxID=562 RepID=UPI003B9FC1E5
MTSANTQYKFSTVKSPQTIQLSTLAKKVADEYGLLLKFQATDKTIANYAYSGPLKNQIKKLQLVGDIDAFIDDDIMV